MHRLYTDGASPCINIGMIAKDKSGGKSTKVFLGHIHLKTSLKSLENEIAEFKKLSEGFEIEAYVAGGDESHSRVLFENISSMLNEQGIKSIDTSQLYKNKFMGIDAKTGKILWQRTEINRDKTDLGYDLFKVQNEDILCAKAGGYQRQGFNFHAKEYQNIKRVFEGKNVVAKTMPINVIEAVCSMIRSITNVGLSFAR